MIFGPFRVEPKAGKLVGDSFVDTFENLSLFSEVRGDNFVGCAFDEDNQPDESEGRAQKWVEQIKGEGIAI